MFWWAKGEGRKEISCSGFFYRLAVILQLHGVMSKSQNEYLQAGLRSLFSISHITPILLKEFIILSHLSGEFFYSTPVIIVLITSLLLGCYHSQICAALQHTSFSPLSQSVSIICILKARSPLRCSLHWPTKTMSFYPLLQKILPLLHLPHYLIVIAVSPPSMTSCIIIISV